MITQKPISKTELNSLLRSSIVKLTLVDGADLVCTKNPAMIPHSPFIMNSADTYSAVDDNEDSSTLVWVPASSGYVPVKVSKVLDCNVVPSDDECKGFQLQAKWKDSDMIEIHPASLENLLSCLDVQRFIGDLNIDEMPDECIEIQQVNQSAIDMFYAQCHDLLHKKVNSWN